MLDSTIDYVQRRLDGDQVKASARKAGFKNGRPSTRAREVEAAALEFRTAGSWPTNVQGNQEYMAAHALLLQRRRELEAIIALTLAEDT